MKWNLEFVDGLPGVKFLVSSGVKDGVEVERVIISRLVSDPSVDGGWKVEYSV